MPFLIGQCCVDQIMNPDEPVSGSGLNEIVPFTNATTLTIELTATRRARFGDALVIDFYIIGDAGTPIKTTVPVTVDNLASPSSYFADLGGLSTGHAIIT